MTPADERAALVALLRAATLPWHVYAGLVEDQGSAVAVLEQERGLLAGDELGEARAAIASWERDRIRISTVLDEDYPENLRAVHDRPPVVFIDGRVKAGDARSVAVIGSRRASADGVARARVATCELVDAGYVVVSGLAAGIDTAAHIAALERGGRTIAVIGTGLGRYYPAENRELQRRLAVRGRRGLAVLAWLAAESTQLPDAQRGDVRAGAGHGRGRGIGDQRRAYAGPIRARARPAGVPARFAARAAVGTERRLPRWRVRVRRAPARSSR